MLLKLEYSISSFEVILLKKLLSVIQAPEFSNLDIASGLSLQHTASSSVQPLTQFPHLHQSGTWPLNGSSVSDGILRAEFREIAYHLGRFRKKQKNRARFLGLRHRAHCLKVMNMGGL